MRGLAQPAQPATEVMVETDADTRPFDLQFELERAEPDLDRLSLRGDTLVPDLIEVCRGKADVQVQARALSVLLRLRAAGIDELLAAAVRSPDLPVRIAVAYHLKLLGGSAGGNYLEQLRGDADAAVRALVTH